MIKWSKYLILVMFITMIAYMGGLKERIAVPCAEKNSISFTKLKKTIKYRKSKFKIKILMKMNFTLMMKIIFATSVEKMIMKMS